jgi:HAD superfamily hydrolase (TIGR01509 family)
MSIAGGVFMRAVIFDLGGTLIHYHPPPDTNWRNTERKGASAFHTLASGRGYFLPEFSDFWESYVDRLQTSWLRVTEEGDGNLLLRELLIETCGGYGLTLQPGDLTDGERCYMDAIRRDITPTDGAAEVLAACKERNLKIGLVSNTMWPGVDHHEDLERFDMLRFFDHLAFSGALGLWKPDPRIFQISLSGLSVRPQEAVFVGDNPQQDIAGAQGVGMRGVLIATSEIPLDGVAPDATIHTPRELLPLLDEWAGD